MRSIHSLTSAILLVTIILSCTTACYRMPTDDDYSLVPVTNNPDFTGRGNAKSSAVPNMNY